MTTSPAEPVIANEDCLRYDPNALRVVSAGADGFEVSDGTSEVMLLLDDETDARNALTWARAFTRQCSTGRDDERRERSRYIVGYWLP